MLAMDLVHLMILFMPTMLGLNISTRNLNRFPEIPVQNDLHLLLTVRDGLIAK
jgi:hypothetical protein